MNNGLQMFLAKLISKKRNYFSIGKDYSNSLSVIVHSDTLFSAICNNFRKLYGKSELESFLEILNSASENEDLLFKISSSFHFIDIYKDSKVEDTIYFIPKPLIHFPFTTESQEYLDQNPKMFKRIEFISLEIASKLKENKRISFSQYHIIGNKYLVDNDDLEKLGLSKFLSLLNKPDPKVERIERVIRDKISIYEILDEQKVRINRKTQESEPFTWPKLKLCVSSYFINEEKRIDYELVPGYYFIFDHSNLGHEIRNKIKASINLIMDEGIGGRRSLGCGLVDDVELIELNEMFAYYNLFDSNVDGQFMNLSLVYPSLEDLQNIEFFNIYGRSGYVYSIENISSRFNDVKFIEEGSLFRKKVRGKLVQVASADFSTRYHAVYKNGIGFYLNLGNLEVK